MSSVPSEEAPTCASECGITPAAAIPAEADRAAEDRASEMHGADDQRGLGRVEPIDDAIGRAPTNRQMMVLRFVRDQVATLGYAPTLRQIGAFMGISSTNGVNDHLRALERKGLIIRDNNRARAIVVTRAGLVALGLVPRSPGVDMSNLAETKLQEARDVARRQRELLMRVSVILREIAPRSQLLDDVRKELLGVLA